MCESMITFHKTVRGARHIREDIACQDSSISYQICDEVEYYIICVADGHGSPEYRRSDKGSKFVTSITESCLSDFAKSLLAGDMSFSSHRQQSDCLEQLTKTIISKWYESVREDLLNNEVTEQDFLKSGRFQEQYRNGFRLERLYGTTLIAALQVKDYLILIQQGDGRCDVFYSDGTVEQPIPWDSRCQGPETTSMCDEDVEKSIRTKVIDLRNKGVIACFIGSDGVEDSYFDNEKSQLGTHRFYMDLCCKLFEYGFERFKDYLDDMLPKFSSSGSKDDISVAGIVDLDKLIQHVDSFAKRVEKYDNEAKLAKDFKEAQLKIISMSRKHGILLKRVADGKSVLDEAQKSKQAYETELQNLNKQREELEFQSEQAKAELDECLKESHSASEQLSGNYRSFETLMKDVIEKIKTACSVKEASYKKILERLDSLDKEIKELENRLESSEKTVRELETKFANIKAEFTEFDEQYTAVEAEKIRIENEIKKLQEE